jgi:hypothetical protein
VVVAVVAVAVVEGSLPVDGRHVLEDDANLHKYDFVDRK